MLECVSFYLDGVHFEGSALKATIILELKPTIVNRPLGCPIQTWNQDALETSTHHL